MELNLKELIIAFNKSPDDALKYFKKLGIKPSANWKETMAAIMDDSFAIAGIKNMDSLMDAKNIIEKAIEDGTPLNEFKAQIKDLLSLANWHTSLVVTQNISNAYHSGTWTRQQSTADLLPLVRFVLGGRSHHTEGCLYLVNNQIAVRMNDPGIAKVYPARHFRCGTTAFVVDEQWCEDNGYKIMKVSDIPSEYLNAPGFGYAPDIPVIERTDLSKYPDDLLTKFKKLIK